MNTPPRSSTRQHLFHSNIATLMEYHGMQSNLKAMNGFWGLASWLHERIIALRDFVDVKSQIIFTFKEHKETDPINSEGFWSESAWSCKETALPTLSCSMLSPALEGVENTGKRWIADCRPSMKIFLWSGLSQKCCRKSAWKGSWFAVSIWNVARIPSSGSKSLNTS